MGERAEEWTEMTKEEALQEYGDIDLGTPMTEKWWKRKVTSQKPYSLTGIRQWHHPVQGWAYPHKRRYEYRREQTWRGLYCLKLIDEKGGQMPAKTSQERCISEENSSIEANTMLWKEVRSSKGRIIFVSYTT